MTLLRLRCGRVLEYAVYGAPVVVRQAGTTAAAVAGAAAAGSNSAGGTAPMEQHRPVQTVVYHHGWPSE